MGKEIVKQVQEAQRVPYRINPRKNMPKTHANQTAAAAAAAKSLQ